MKNILLIGSFFGSVIAYSLFHTRELGICNIYCGSAIDQFQNTFLFFLPVLFFSLITYFAPDRVFASWWKFARIGIPVAFGLSLAINLELHHNPNGTWQDIFDIPALILIYGIFTIGSAWQIWKGWRSN